MKSLFILVIFFNILIVNHSLWLSRHKSRAIDELIYQTYEISDHTKSSFCIRRFNFTHTVGCSSNKYGNIGNIHSIANVEQLELKLNSNKDKIILLINIFNFDVVNYFKDYRKKLEKSQINGVIFYQKGIFKYDDKINQYKSFAHDSRCPNINYGFQTNKTNYKCESSWIEEPNPFIDFALINWPFPIFFIRNETLIQQLLVCESTLKCLVQLQSFMFGAINSQSCLLRSHHSIDMIETSYCKPILARNIFSSLFPVSKNTTYDNRSILVLTSRLDSFTIFDSFSPGANSVYSGLVVLIAVAHLLNQHRASIESKKDRKIKNVLYALFDGESFGYIGSSSWMFYNNFVEIYQNNSFTDKFKMETIAHTIEMNQLLSLNEETIQFWLHGNWSLDHNNRFADEFLKFSNNHNKLKIIKTTGDKKLPSSTISIFQKFDPKIESFLISGFGSKFNNPFYHSHLDLGENYQLESVVAKLHLLTNLVANFIYELLIGDQNKKESLKADYNFIQNLIECFFGLVPTCSLFDGTLNLTDVKFKDTTPMQRETELLINTIQVKSSAKRIINNIHVKEAIQTILFYANGQRIQCFQNDSTMQLIPLGHNKSFLENRLLTQDEDCLASQNELYIFESPYVEYLGRSFHMEINDLRTKTEILKQVDFSTWTESRYDAARQPYIRIFLAQNPMLENFTYWLGFIVLIFSFVIICFFNKYSEQFYSDQNEIVPNKFLNTFPIIKDLNTNSPNSD